MKNIVTFFLFYLNKKKTMKNKLLNFANEKKIE